MDTKILKEKLNNYEPEYNHNDWLRLEKSLNKKPFFGTTKGITLISVIGIILIATIGLILNSEKDSIEAKKIENLAEIILENKSPKLSIVDNVEETLNTEESISINIINSNNKVNTKVSQNNSKNEGKNQEPNAFISDKSDKNNTSDNNTSSTIINQNNLIEKNEIIDHQTKVKNIEITFELESKCVPAKLFLISNNVPDNYSIIWYIDDNNTIINENKSEYIFNQKGTYLPKAQIIYEDAIIQTIVGDKIEIYPQSEIDITENKNKNQYSFEIINDKEFESVSWTINNDKYFGNKISYNFLNEVTHTVMITSTNIYGCKSEKTLSILIENEQQLFFPNAFIPYSGDINSYFGPIGENITYNMYKLSIYNLSGRKVFETSDINEKWNGKFNNNGSDSPEGIYLWEMYLKDTNGTIKTDKGRVNLIRK